MTPTDRQQSEVKRTPTKAQRVVLEAMRGGAWIEHWVGYSVPVELCGAGPDRIPLRFVTHLALYTAGWTHGEPKRSGQYREYRITPSGRAALLKAEAR